MQVIISDAKQCSKCHEIKTFDMFYKANKNGLRGECKICTKLFESIRAKNNPEKMALKVKNWRDANPDKAKKITQKYFKNNKEIMYKRTEIWRNKNREYASKISANWAKNNPAKAASNAANRRARILNATPAWADFSAIKSKYEMAKQVTEFTGIKHHVDHVIPLKNNFVCGLHVYENLMVIPAVDNHIKNNKHVI